MKRKLTILRLMLCRNGYRRAEYLKRKKYFYKQGEGCFLSPHNYGTEPYLIALGNNVHIASGVTFVTHDIVGWMFKNIDLNNKHVKRVGKILIGDNVFIGANATILYDVKIGNNVIVAAGALVNKDIPDGTIYGGVPARQIGTFDEYLEKSRVYSQAVSWEDEWEFVQKKQQQIEQFWRNEK